MNGSRVAVDREAADARRLLSSPIDALAGSPGGMDRRRFLQAVGLGVGGAAAGVGGLWHPSAASAVAPIGATDGIVVCVFMYGGNDALNTVVPYDDADYRRYHGAIALDPTSVLPLEDGLGLHPRLGFVKERYDAGEVAIIEGIGAPGGDLSHFSSQATWFGGSAEAGAPTSGWLGRWLDSIADYDPLQVVSIGNTVPLSVIGRFRRASAVPETPDGFGSRGAVPDRLVYEAVRGFSARSAARGAWHDAIARTEAAQLDVVQTVGPLLSPALPIGIVERRLELAARLVNADLGVRVVELGWGDFDTHRDQRLTHDDRMRELDTGLRGFFGTLAPRFRSRVTVMVISEFGRTPWANDSGGTDHGEAGVAFVLGAAVRGGRHGEPPALAGLGRWDQQRPTVDHRMLYHAVVERWLGADPVEVIGAGFPGLDLFARSPGFDQPEPEPEPVPTPVPVPVAPTEPAPPVEPAPAPPVSPPADVAGDFVPLSPTRILDTRNRLGAVGPLAGAGELELVVSGLGAIPATGVTAVAVNLTATGGSTDGYLTAWPSGAPRPETSTVNWRAGRTVPNLAVVQPGVGGAIRLWNASGTVHVLADVVGYFRSTDHDRFVPLSPARILDTRNAIGASAGKVGPGGALDLAVAGAPGSGVPAGGVDAVVLNVTVDGPTKDSYLTVWPGGEARPEASSLNFERGQTVANLVIAKLGATGTVGIFNATGETHVLADVVGCFAADGLGRHRPVGPVRVLDTRNGIGSSARLGSAALTLPVAGASGIPSTATGVVMNVTVTGPSASSYLTVWPAGEGQPTASSLNYPAGLTIANLVIARVGGGGAVALANAFGTADVIVDVLGYFA